MSRRRKKRSRMHLPKPRLATSPKRALAASAVAGLLIAAIATTTLPDVLATASPDLALRLSPNHSKALVAKAVDLRARMLAIVTAGTGTGEATPPGKENGGGSGDLADLRKEIRSLALRALQRDPLEARALVLLAETSEDTDTIRSLMTAAVERSRRESIAAFWLLNDAFQRGDTQAALRHAEILMRTREQLNPYVLSYLGQLAEKTETRAALVAWLAEPRNTGLRRTMLVSGPSYVRDARTPLEIISGLSAAGVAVGAAEIKPYLGLLVEKGHVELAYYTWLNQLGPEGMRKAGHIFNGDFETDTSGLPFDWHIAPARNATAEIRHRDAGPGRALQLRFGAGRVELPGLWQIVMVPPGSFRFSFSYKGETVGKRGLRWRMTCLYPPHAQILETEMMTGRTEKWIESTTSFSVPADPGCRAQRLWLVHDSRSASEQLITGEAWFDDVKLQRIATEKPAAGGSQ